MDDFSIIQSARGGLYHLFGCVLNESDKIVPYESSVCGRAKYVEGDNIHLECGDEYHCRQEAYKLDYSFCKYCVMSLYGGDD